VKVLKNVQLTCNAKGVPEEEVISLVHFWCSGYHNRDSLRKLFLYKPLAWTAYYVRWAVQLTRSHWRAPLT
jgi:hypothetical protein